MLDDGHKELEEMVMVKGTQYSQQFKKEEVNYRNDHPQLIFSRTA